MKIYIIVESNGYDGFCHPDDYYFTDEQAAQEYCDKLNKDVYSRDRFSVLEMEPKL